MIERKKMDTLALDFDKLSPTILKKIETGKYVISQSGGVVRKTNGKIVKYIPLKKINCEKITNTQQALTSFKSALGISVAIPTTIVIQAAIVSTTLILDELNKIEILAEEISKKIDEQNKLQYFLQLRDYLAVATSLKELSFTLNENKDLALMKLERLSTERHKVLILSLERIMNINDLTSSHKEIVLNFLHQVLILLPKLFYLEKDIAIGLGKVKYAKNLEENFIYEYIKLNNKYKLLLNNEYKYFLKGEGLSSNLLKLINEYKEEDKINQFLLKQLKNKRSNKFIDWIKNILGLKQE
jgi:hypothetical protein